MVQAQVTSPKVQYAYDNLRRTIAGMPVGMPLPTVLELRKQLGVAQLTVQRACDVLQAQGQIDRFRGKGMFVADRTETGEFAILIRPELLNAAAHPYYSLAISAMLKKIGELKGNYQAKLHCGDVTYLEKDWPAGLDVLDAPVRARLRGIFSFNALYELTEKLEKSEIPFILLSSLLDSKYTVGFDQRHTLRDAVTCLAASGCKTVGAIWVRGVKHIQKLYESKCKEFAETAASAGIETKKSWMLGLESEGGVTEKMGYDLFLKFWKLPDRPDSLFVGNDVLCKGVLHGIMHLGVKVPEQLKLISHANRGFELLFNKPITRIEYDANKLAGAAVEMMYKLVQGKTPENKRVLLPGNLIQGETA